MSIWDWLVENSYCNELTTSQNVLLHQLHHISRQSDFGLLKPAYWGSLSPLIDTTKHCWQPADAPCTVELPASTNFSSYCSHTFSQGAWTSSRHFAAWTGLQICRNSLHWPHSSLSSMVQFLNRDIVPLCSGLILLIEGTEFAFKVAFQCHVNLQSLSV